MKNFKKRSMGIVLFALILSAIPSLAFADGACCTFSGCVMATSEMECLQGGGTWAGEGTSCSDNPSPCLGACCYTGEICLMKTEIECAMESGNFKGLGTSCSTPDICVDVTPGGACCTPSGCVQAASIMDCLISYNGNWAGDGTSCSDDPPPCLGACCTMEGCVDGIDATTCVTTYGGSFLGLGTTCGDPDICDGACCVGEVCQYVDMAECAALSGNFVAPGHACTENTCVEPTGACCYDGGCVEVTPSECYSTYNGNWRGDGTTCSDPDICTGACCVDDDCQIVDILECNQLGGEFRGTGTNCTPNPCGPTGACCITIPVMMCQLMTADECSMWGSNATYHGDGTYCDGIDGDGNGVPDVCEVDEGACCYGDGTCMMKTDVDCQLDGGEFKGLGSDCATPDICPQPSGFEYLPGDANMINGQWPPLVIGADVTYLVGYFRGINGPCLVGGFFNSADANGDCLVIGSDVTKMVTYFRGLTTLSHCADYPPAWPTPADLPAEEPAGWPNCETAR